MTTSRHDSLPVAVLGAGLSGLVAASELIGAGHRVIVLERGSVVGGRLATARLGAATIDHGAQFFTVRGEEFAALVDGLVDAGVVFQWCDGFDDPPDGYPRYAAQGGMTTLAERLATGIDVRLATEVRTMVDNGASWTLRWAGGEIEAAGVIATAPVAETLAVLDRGPSALDPAMGALRDIDYKHTLAALVVLDGPSAIPAPGGRQLDDGAFTFVADNHQKRISARSAVTLHSDHDLARERWHDDPADVLRELMELGARWLGDAPVLHTQLEKWRYAGPVEVWPAPFAVAVDGPAPLLLAGDAFDGPKVEGAFRSGLAAGREMADRLGRR